MAIPVEISFSAPDPDVAPATFGEAVSQLNSLVTATITQAISTFVLGIEVPAVEDQDKPWFRLNTLNNPVGWHFFTQGVWVREEPIVSARFGLFTGDPADLFDATGRGLKGPGPIALDYWGWALMNGNNGTQNWSNRFVINGAMDNDGIIGFANGWRTNVNGTEEATGGVSEVTLDVDNTYTPGLVVGKYTADGIDPSNDDLFGTPGAGHDTTLMAANTDPMAISVVNPFVAAARIQFVGYI